MTSPDDHGTTVIAGPQVTPIIVTREGDDAAPARAKAVRELCVYIHRLSGRSAAVRPDGAAPESGQVAWLMLGLADDDLASQWTRQNDDLGNRAPGAFVLRTGKIENQPAVCVIGRDAMGLLYGVYALIEAMGATFTLSQDLLPPVRETIAIPELDRVCEPAISKRRGFHIPMLDINSGIQSFEDYRRLIDQMVKLRLNYLNFLVCAAEPWVDYTFRGENNQIGDINSRQSGYLTPKMVVPDPRTDDIRVGREHFAGRPWMAPLELQGVRDREDGITRFQALMHRVLGYAKASGLAVALSTDLTEVPPNFARHMKSPQLSNPDTTIFGQKVDPLDPVMAEHAETILRALLEEYPELDEFFVFNPEGYHYRPDAEEVYQKLKPAFANARRTFQDNWIETCPYARGGKTAEEIIEVDIAHFESARRSVRTAREIRPDLTIGMAFLFRGYLLQDADQRVDRDVPFMEYQSSGVVAVQEDVNAAYFADMGDRDRYIIPRVDDDGSMFGIPFYLRQFERDGVFGPAVQSGVNGFVGQLWRVRGTEHHTRFLARGAWEPELTPEAFYQEYAQDIFGSEAAPELVKAFKALEECEERLGWRGLKNFRWADGCRELASLGAAVLRKDKPYEGPSKPEAMWQTATCVTIFEDTRIPRDTIREGKIEVFLEAVNLLDRAIKHMEAARPAVSEKGRPLLEYLISKTGAYRTHLDMVATLCRGFAAYARAFMDDGHTEADSAEALEQSAALFHQANDKAIESAQRAAEIVDHPSDLAVLFQVNRFNVEKVERVAGLVERVKRYHQGEQWTDPTETREHQIASDEGWNN